MAAKGDVVKVNAEAFDEGVASQNALLHVKEQKMNGTIQHIRMVKEGSKGFLGFGIKPNLYEVEIKVIEIFEVTEGKTGTPPSSTKPSKNIGKSFIMSTWDMTSPRIKLSENLSPTTKLMFGTDASEIRIKWILDEQLVMSISNSENIVLIKHPTISAGEIAQVPFELDPVELFSRKELPNPYPETSDVSKNKFDTPDHRKENLPGIWKNLLLVHPNSDVVINLLRSQSEFSLSNDTDMAGLLVCAIDEIKHEVAKTVWRCNDEPEFLFTVLGNRGITVSGILHEEGKKAAIILREHCPDTMKDWFRKKATDLFGASVAGVESTGIKTNVKLKEKYTKRINSSTIGTYEVYTAPSKADARSFLESYEITKEYFYIEVETPEGPVGKDIAGIY